MSEFYPEEEWEEDERNSININIWLEENKPSQLHAELSGFSKMSEGYLAYRNNILKDFIKYNKNNGIKIMVSDYNAISYSDKNVIYGTMR